MEQKSEYEMRAELLWSTNFIVAFFAKNKSI